MSVELAVELVRGMFYIALLVVSPVLVAAVTVGTGVSLGQALTSIQEQTLSFVPKLFAVVSVLVTLSYWIAEK
ncbi:flagellar biosynthetic protein FliQ, partial [Arthrospira platensis SPKY1]|nr:flagellar biosynthetic protein FliQ [Arthrospira platensis SPKY1]